MATIKDVAKASGLSPATVSRVLNNAPKVSQKAKAKIERAIAELGFHPNANARALVTKSTNTIGVVISELADPFFAQMVSSIEKEAKKKKMKVLISTGSLDAKKELQAIKSLQAQRCDAMVVNSKALDDDILIDLAKKIPGFVLINKFIPEISERCIWLDNIKGGETMAKYIASLGHKKIAVLSTKEKVYDATRRLEGIHNALNELNLPLPEKQIVYSSPDPAGGEQAIAELIDNKVEFTAVLAYNDAMAAGAISKLVDLGYQIPSQLSVVGFDDVLIAKYCMPQLTTIKYPIDIMAQKATELALKLSKNTAEETLFSQTYKYTPILIKRSSASKL